MRKYKEILCNMSTTNKSRFKNIGIAIEINPIKIKEYKKIYKKYYESNKKGREYKYNARKNNYAIKHKKNWGE